MKFIYDGKSTPFNDKTKMKGNHQTSTEAYSDNDELTN